MQDTLEWLANMCPVSTAVCLTGALQGAYHRMASDTCIQTAITRSVRDHRC